MPAGALVDVAAGFTPRFQVMGRLVLLDVCGVSRLFGDSPALARALYDAVAARTDNPRVAVSASAATAILAALAHHGMTVVAPEEEATFLAPLPLEVLVAFAHLRLSVDAGASDPDSASIPALEPASPVAVAGRHSPPAGGGRGPGTGGWHHPRDMHQARHARRPRTPAGPSTERVREDQRAIMTLATTFRRWGVGTLGAVAALPRADVHARLGERGTTWQDWAAGQDVGVLVPWTPEPVFDAALELEWPVEGYEPLSFVLTRLFEPLALRLEQADCGAVTIHTALHLTTRAVHLRTIPLPAPLRDAKAWRTLVLLDLESHPPPAAVDRVHVVLDPTPARVLQWQLFERAQPAPEQVATLLARLTALMGDGHVGSPMVCDTWKPGAFRVVPFRAEGGGKAEGTRSQAEEERQKAEGERQKVESSGQEAEGRIPLAFRRFRLPVPVRVRVDDGRPVRLITDRLGFTGGTIVQAAGPWRTSGEWWATGAVRGGDCESGRVRHPEGSAAGAGVERRSREGHRSRGTHDMPSSWDRDEWDIAMADGTVYRLAVERSVGQWFLEGVVD